MKQNIPFRKNAQHEWTPFHRQNTHLSRTEVYDYMMAYVNGTPFHDLMNKYGISKTTHYTLLQKFLGVAMEEKKRTMRANANKKSVGENKPILFTNEELWSMIYSYEGLTKDEQYKYFRVFKECIDDANKCFD